MIERDLRIGERLITHPIENNRRIFLWRRERELFRLETEPHLQLQAPIICGLCKTPAPRAASGLVGQSEYRRRDGADDRSGIGMVQQVADGHRDGEVEAMIDRRRGGAGGSHPECSASVAAATAATAAARTGP